MSKSLKISNNEKLSLISNLATMYNAGIPILETIESMTEDSKGNTRKILISINADLVQGESMYTAFSKFPAVFSKVTVNVIKAAEEAGTLDVVLKDIKNQIQKDMEFMDNVKSALTYPLVIFVLFFGILLLILVVVVPKIGTVFLQLRVELPLPTKILMLLSDIIVHKTIPLVLVVALITTLLILLYKKQRSLVLAMVFSLPVVSDLVKEIDLARFSRSMFLLLSSGITITNALELAKEVVMRRDVKKIVINAQSDMLGGKKLSDAFKKKKEFFPGIIIKIIEAGEKTGTLDKSMEEISSYMDYKVSGTLKKLITLLEPIMLIFVGAMVGAMMYSIISPIYGLISQVGGGR